jgi:hypothetical protein
MTADDPMHDSQPDPRPLKSILRMEALEYAEKAVGVAHVEADAIVAYVVDEALALAQGAHLDARWFASEGKFESVRQKIGEDLLE